MDDCLDIKSFVDELEIYAQQKLHYPVEVGELLQIVMKTGMTNKFEELIFQAKFLVRTQEMMKRIGPDVDGFEKLSAEFQSGVKKSIDILNRVVERAPFDIARKLKSTFFIAETESYYRLMKLFSDLSWIKNWQIDGKPLPYEVKSTVRLSCQGRVKEKESEPLVRIQKSAFSGIIIFILFLFIDPPVTVIGWILSLGIAVFLMYIVVQIYLMNRTPKP